MNRKESPGNLLSRIPKDINIQNILSQFNPKTEKKYLGTSATLTKNIGNYEKEQLYWKRKVEYIAKQNLGPDNVVAGGYKVDWRKVYDSITSEVERQSERDTPKKYSPSIWNNLLLIDIDEPDYIELALDMGANLSYKNDVAIHRAIKKGYTKILKYILRNIENFEEIQIYAFVSGAAEKGSWDTIMLLIEDGRFDLETILKIVAEYDNLDMVKYLIEVKKVDPSSDNNRLIIALSWKGQLNIINYLLKDKRVDPSDQNNEAIIEAAREGHLDVVERLLEDDRVDPSDQNNRAIGYASKNGYLDIVKLLLKDPRVNALESKNDKAIISAVRGRQLNVVNYLLEEGLVSSDSYEESLKIAHGRIMKRLLDYANETNINISVYKLNTLTDKDSDYWKKFIKKYYDYDVMFLDGTLSLIRTQQIMGVTDYILGQYHKSPNCSFKEQFLLVCSPKELFIQTRDKLGELLDEAVSHKLFTASKYLVNHGAPITWKHGSVFAKAVELWGLGVLELVSSERFTNYMRDRTRAVNLVNMISKHVQRRINDKSILKIVPEHYLQHILDYLFLNDHREPKSNSYAYNILRDRYQSREITEYFDRKIYSTY